MQKTIKKMVNQIVLNYLRQHKDKYPLDDLKKKILEKGYSHAELNEALRELNLHQHQTKRPSAQHPNSALNHNTMSSYTSSRGFNWIRLASYIGFALFAIYVISFVLGFFNIKLMDYALPSGSLILPLIIVFLIFAIGIFYIYGFARLAKHKQSRLLRFASISSIILLAILFVLYIFLLFYAKYTLISYANSLSSITGMAVAPINTSFNASPNSNLPVNYYNSVYSSNSAYSWIMLVAVILLIIFVLVVRYCFSIGLIKIKERFSKLAGWLDLIYTIILSLIILAVMGFVIYIMLNPLAVLSLLSGFGTLAYLIKIANIVINLLIITPLLFESLVLFYASKKFR